VMRWPPHDMVEPITATAAKRASVARGLTTRARRINA
jgi:hypothetical protein